MKTEFAPAKRAALALLALSTVFTQPSTVHAQGSLTPPGAPAPTMKTLAQIEPRVAITGTGAYTISQPGSYYLATNITVSSGNGISILTNGVTLDLNGFGIYSTAPSATGVGILLGSSRTNITIFNGFIAGRVTQTGGVFTGGGFDSGVFITIDTNNIITYGLPFNVRVSGLNVSGCMSYGIGLGGVGTSVDSCSVQIAGTSGISAGIVKNSTASECGTSGISGLTISDCIGQSTGSGSGISANFNAYNCYGTSVSGIGVNASEIAQNCYGSTTSGDYGLYAEVAQNCVGINVTGTGLRATSSAANCSASGGTVGMTADNTADNCSGRCNTNGIGLQAYRSVNNSYGYCPAGNSGIGLSASQANNCYAQSDGNGVALSANVAIGCQGRCYGNNYAISAYIVNSCYAYRETGTPPVSFGYKYNMP